MILAHGAGAGMNHSFMVALAEELAEKNIGTLRFNFPFVENKKGRPDLPAVAHKAIETAFQYVKENYNSPPIFLSGKSFGGRMSSQYLSLHTDSAVKGIAFYGFPLHPINKPSTDRAEHLKNVKQPMLFLQGTKDKLAEWHLIEEVCSSLPNATLVKIDGADHAFKKGKENLVPLLARHTKEWIDTI
jgi:predicted alpha/beta-hydrolase family hydrolase